EGAALHRGNGRLDRRERRDHEHRQIVVDLLELFQRGEPVDAGHHDVYDRGVKWNGLGELESFRTRRGKTYVVPLAREERLENLAHDFFVVDDQNRTSAPHDYNLPLLLGRASRKLDRRRRKLEDEPSTLSNDALAVDRTVMLTDDPVGDRESEAGALTGGLRCEERVINAREVLVRNT